MPGKIENLLTRYEKGINNHDCQHWENHLLQDPAIELVNEISKRKTRRKTELLDVDLVRGSTFPKSKTEHDFKSIIMFSAMSILFFPFRGSWWIKKTNVLCYIVGCLIFATSLVNLYIYHNFLCIHDNQQCHHLQFHEIYEPILLFIVIAFMQCQIVSPLKLKNLDYFDQQIQSRQKRTSAERVSSLRAPRKITPIRRQSVHHCVHPSNNLDSLHETSSGSDHDDHLDTASDCHQHHQHHETHSSEENKESDHEEEPEELNTRTSRKSSRQHDDSDGNSSGEDNHDYKQYSPIVLKIGTTVWNEEEAPSKIYMSALQIGNKIFDRSRDDTKDSVQYFVIGMICSAVIALLPVMFKHEEIIDTIHEISNNVPSLHSEVISAVQNMNQMNFTICEDMKLKIGDILLLTVALTSTVSRLILTMTLFLMLSVAERAFKRKYFTAKLFSHITSTRKSMKFNIPHFRLYKVRNIKAWLCVRAFLRKRGPQRSIDCIVNTAFALALANVSWLCYQLLGEDESNQEINATNCIVIAWSVSVGLFLVRYMTLAMKINKKYRNLSVLLTEQINLYLQMEMKPHKKEQLQLAGNVLKLSNDLLKEIPTEAVPSGYLASSPFLYNFFKVLMLSAVSGVLSEMLGFKLKLYKVKLK